MGLNASVLYRSAAQTDPRPQNSPKWKHPLPASSPICLPAFGFDQAFSMLASSYPPFPLNTPANLFSSELTDTNAILVDLSQPSPAGAGLVTASGSFIHVPASWNDTQSTVVSFPGWINTSLSGLARQAKSRLVDVRLQYDYFVIDPYGVLNGAVPVAGVTNGTVNDSGGNPVQLVGSKGDIPILPRAVWLNTLSGSPEVYSEVNDLVPAGGVTVGTLTYVTTWPTQNQYAGWCAVASYFLAAMAAGGPGWDSTHPPVWNGNSTGSGTAYGQYQLDNSKVVEYQGTVVCRVTPFVMPE